MKFENTEVWGFEHSLRGMRNPKNSWDKSDSEYWLPNMYMNENVCGEDVDWTPYHIGQNDMKLAQTLIKGGNEHRKFLRQIFVSVDITAPLYWWKEFDTYKVGTTANSTSTMHKIMSKEFTQDMFEIEGIRGFKKEVKQFVPQYTDEEIWKDYPECNLYQISSHGRVKRKAYKPVNNHFLPEIILEPQYNESGYLYVKIFLDNKLDKRQNRLINQLVAKTFLDNPNNYIHVNHKDGNKLNNHISNLEWVSDEDNQKHAVANNLRQNKTYTYTGKLTQKQREEIKDKYKRGDSARKIAPDYNVTHTTILSVVNGEYDYGEHYSNDFEFFILILNRLNELRNEYLQTKNKDVWYSLIKILPESWLQTRTITMSYENVRNMYFQRRNHKLTEWSKSFIEWVKTLPYAEKLIMYEE